MAHYEVDIHIQADTADPQTREDVVIALEALLPYVFHNVLVRSTVWEHVDDHTRRQVFGTGRDDR